MVELTPQDAAVLGRLVRFDRLPLDDRKELITKLKTDNAKRVGEALLDEKKYLESDQSVKATVDRFRNWRLTNKRLTQKRVARRRKVRTHSASRD